MEFVSVLDTDKNTNMTAGSILHIVLINYTGNTYIFYSTYTFQRPILYLVGTTQVITSENG